MLENINCAIVCTKDISPKGQKRFRKLIKEEYRGNLLVDELPAGEKIYFREPTTKAKDYYYERGYVLGQVVDENYYLNNHLSFVIKYHKTEQNTYRVVGFEILPSSIQHGANTCNADTKITGGETRLSIPLQQTPISISFSYSVEWSEDPTIEWASRWDLYLRNVPGAEIHWFTLGNSILIAVFLTVVVALIMIRTVYQDIARYNNYIQIEESKEEIEEESGWKLVHGDVFRPPVSHPMLFAIMMGSGVQLFWMTFIVLFFFCLGFVTPAVRGSLLTAALFLFVFLSSLAGYFAARLYKFFRGTNWKTLTVWVAMFVPGVIFTITLFINFFFWYLGSTRAIPFLSLISLILLWIGVSAPLVLIGAFFGFRQQPYEVAVKTNQIPRQIIDQPWYMTTIPSVLLAGLLPFGGLFLELYFVMSSIWLHQVFYVFGLLFVIYTLTIISSAEVSIVLCYFQLIGEDWHWWWRSVLTGGSISFYIFGYSFFYASKLAINKLTTLGVYFGNMFILSFIVFLITGSVGFYSCFWFTRKIYQSIKVD